jgi:hypothetical protein
MNQAELKAELDRAQEAIAKFSGTREKLAQQTAKLEAKLQAWITAQYGEEAAKRVEVEKAAIEARKKLSNTEAASYLKAMAAVTAAQAKELAERERQQAAFAKYVEQSNARIATAERAEVAASAKAVIAAEKEKAAEVARQAKAREVQISSLSKLIIRQASMEATAQKTAAREAQTAYTEGYNTRKAQILSQMRLRVLSTPRRPKRLRLWTRSGRTTPRSGLSRATPARWRRVGPARCITSGRRCLPSAPP